jgi:putative SOS response-associated peptidase YedK
MQCITAKNYGDALTMKTGEILPDDAAPIVIFEKDMPTIHLMKWGFPKMGDGGLVVIAKSETAYQKRMFASPLARRRCVILSTGFYDWKKSKGRAKDKIFFNTADSPMLYMAGLYTEYKIHNHNEPVSNRFVILTQPANDSINELYSRMPVILYKSEIHRWLTDFTFAKTIMSRDTVRLIRTAA